jgi:hypothetical protein
MRGAFVVQLRKAGHLVDGRLEGSVEEVDTGKRIDFRLPDELVAFLRERSAEIRQGVADSEGVK